MSKVSDTRIISVDRERVFDYMDQPEHQKDITPHMRSIDRIQRLPHGGIRARYVYEMAGIRLRGSVQARAHERPYKIIFDMMGAITGEIAWYFEALAPQKTQVTYVGDYRLAIPVVGSLLAWVLKDFNRREIQYTLRNLEHVLTVHKQA